MVVGHDDVLSAGSYTFLPGVGAGEGALLNDADGGQTEVPEPACDQYGKPVLSGAYLAVYCIGKGIAVYGVGDGSWRQLAPMSCPGTQESPADCELTSAGRYWLGFTVTCYHCAPSLYVQNIATGDFGDAGPAVTGNRLVDLNAVDLAGNLCSGGYIEAPDNSVISDGPFVIRETSSALTVQRCGSKKTLTIPGKPSFVRARPHLVVFFDRRGNVHGIFLPSGKQFALRQPARIAA